MVGAKGPQVGQVPPLQFDADFRDICERLDAEIQAAVDAYADPWLQRDAPAYAGQFAEPRSVSLPVLAGS